MTAIRTDAAPFIERDRHLHYIAKRILEAYADDASLAFDTSRDDEVERIVRAVLLDEVLVTAIPGRWCHGLAAALESLLDRVVALECELLAIH